MSRILLRATMIAFGCMFTAPAMAVDGVVLINQNKALNGNVTPGDAPGFPVTLTLSGSYKLSGNLFPGANLDGISATNSDITIDLNGFVMSGGPAGGTNNALNGIVGLGDRLTVLNGKINAFEVAGISYANRAYLIVENMRIINNGHGIDNNKGPLARIQNNTIATNVDRGITCGLDCHIEGNIVSANGGTGIAIGSGAVLGNTIHFNGGPGILNIFEIYNISSFDVGFGNNSIVDNSDPQVFNAEPMTPNYCSPGGNFRC